MGLLEKETVKCGVAYEDKLMHRNLELYAMKAPMFDDSEAKI